MGCSGSGERTVTAKRAPESGAEVIEVGGGHAVFLGAGSPLSQAQNLGLHGPVVGDDLGRMERFFRDRGSTTQIEVASLADPSLLAALSARGYLIAEQTHSLVCSLKAKPLREQPMHRSASTGTVEIIRVGPDELEHWVDVVLRCFFEEPESPPPSLREGAIAMSLVPGTTSWLARVDGQPAGGGLLMIHDGLALICGDGTLPRYRHRGVQTLLLQGGWPMRRPPAASWPPSVLSPAVARSATPSGRVFRWSMPGRC